MNSEVMDDACVCIKYLPEEEELLLPVVIAVFPSGDLPAAMMPPASRSAAPSDAWWCPSPGTAAADEDDE